MNSMDLISKAMKKVEQFDELLLEHKRQQREKLSDNEIIKALECCVKDNSYCYECPLRNDAFCRVSIIRFSYELVKRMERKSTQFTAFLIDYKNAYEKVKSKNTDLISVNTQLKGEIEGYRHLDTILHTAVDKLTNEIKGEVINEVKERLRANADIYNANYPYGCSLKVINNITKEMAGDSK